MSPCRRPETYTFREDGNEPVVTCGSAPLALRAAVGRGAESGMIGLRLRIPGSSDVGNWYSPKRSYPYAGTTRIRFEGFPRPEFSGQRYLSPFPGAPLGLPQLFAVCPAAVKRWTQCKPRVGAGRARGEAVGLPSWPASV